MKSRKANKDSGKELVQTKVDKVLGERARNAFSTSPRIPKQTSVYYVLKKCIADNRGKANSR